MSKTVSRLVSPFLFNIKGFLITFLRTDLNRLKWIFTWEWNWLQCLQGNRAKLQFLHWFRKWEKHLQEGLINSGVVVYIVFRTACIFWSIFCFSSPLSDLLGAFSWGKTVFFASPKAPLEMYMLSCTRSFANTDYFGFKMYRQKIWMTHMALIHN